MEATIGGGFYKTNHIEPSMSRRGTCWDNVVAESFFSSLKKACIKKKDLPNTRAREDRNI